MTTAIVFDDGNGLLSPLTDLRAAFDVRTGALTTLERLRDALGLTIVSLATPDHLAGLTRERHGLSVNETEGIAGSVTFVNGRCPLAPDELARLAPGQRIVEAKTGETIAWTVDGLAAGPIRVEPARNGETVAELEFPALLTRPWHVRSFRDACIAVDLEVLGDSPTQEEVPPGVTAIGDHELTIDPGAMVYPGVILDLENGPIVIGEGATVRPGAVVIGPAFIGRGSTIMERAVIKGHTAIGPVCKVGGEVGGTIFQGYANKAHDGHLGDSWVGEWANLGAGTTNSNLLNTYGEVVSRAGPTGPNERTGETYLGAIIGDHVKTAICTRLMTGCVLHTGSMFAQSAAVSGSVGPFSWATDEGRRGYRFDKFLDVARTVMARRKVEPSAGYVKRLAELHAAAG